MALKTPRAPALRLVEPSSTTRPRPLAPATEEQLRPTEPNDAELVAACRAHERGAFEALYRRHAAFAMSLAVRIQGHAGDAEDIVHDAFLRAHDGLDGLQNALAFRSWLGSIVVRLVRSRMRRRRLLGRLGLAAADPIDLDSLVHPGASPEQRLELREVYAVLTTLDVERRIAWTLRYVEGNKLEEVSMLTDASLATVKRRILAAQEALILGLGESSAEALFQGRSLI